MQKTVYWWSSGRKDAGNFGDILNPILLDYFNIPYKFTKSWKNTKLDLIAIGSIIDKANAYTTVLGSGVMTSESRINSNADFRLVRGPITRDCILRAGGKCDKNYGDPGLLLPLFCEEQIKKHEIGFVPHFLDYEQVKEKYPKEFVIDIMDKDPLNVARKISSCKSIISSSLHGIIAAHSYGIPAAWAVSDVLISKFSDTKFKDYYMSIDTVPIKSSFDDPKFSKPNFIEIENIIKIFNEYAKEAKS